MIELEDEADVLRPPMGQPPLGHRGNLLFLYPHMAFAGRIDPGDQVQERRLARSAGAHQPQKLPIGHFQRQVLQHVDPLAAAAEVFVNVFDAGQWRKLSKT